MGRKPLSAEEKTFTVLFRGKKEDREILDQIIAKISQPGFTANKSDALRYTLHTHNRCPICGGELENPQKGKYICPVCSE